MAILAIFVVWLVSRSFAPTALENAEESCVIAGAELGDEGKSLTLDMRGDEEVTGLDIDEVLCVLTEIGVPDSVLAEMEQTTALQGRQEATWDDFSVSWTYHPDHGLDIIVVQDP